MGYNLAWVLIPDNADIPVEGFRDIFQDEKGEHQKVWGNRCY